ncbi:unnamed protein product [Callosobruchus maculatus]|uniref:Activating transcription factor 7-interacting protein Fn3 domain-containing protein n=1 Tax=Callosobruchus maculatus TaxID=64391 RepID=A0A653DVR4_CALMS|nr:unnamed protein product [Callosobruchus maculatus]
MGQELTSLVDKRLESTKEVASQKKRSLSPVQQNETPSKKIRLSEEKQLQDKQEATPKLDDAKEGQPSGNVKVLLSFQKFMQNKKIKDKLTRSDLEQFCIQKICEAIIHKTDVGELHQTVKKQEQLIENLRKDLQTLSKQARDLDIVNKKLMNELKTQNNGKKPIVPLKITRSVGLQVKLNMGAEPTRRKSTTTTATSSTPTKTASSPLVNRTRNVQTSVAGNSVVRTISQGQSPVRSPASQSTTTPILTKALSGTQQQAVQQRSSPLVTHSTPASPMKRGGPIRKSPGMAEAHKVLNNSSPLKQTPNKAPGPMKPSQPGVIDLTDEDDRVAAPKAGGAPKTVRGVPIVQKVNGGTPAKGVQAKNVVKVGQQATPPGRTVAGLPQSVRLTPNQVKNGIAIPVSTGSTTQLMYVVQPSSTANNNQKTLTLLNLPTQQLLTSGMNGSTVSMISSKSPGTVQVKQLATRKHPAPLPLPPVMPVNSTFKPVLPKPHLSIRKTDNGIILQWRMPYNLDLYESIASYQLFAYQETNAPPSTEMWRKVGDVKALALPMACTLTQFADKNKYYFAVRSVDVHKRIGAFSDPEEISL